MAVEHAENFVENFPYFWVMPLTCRHTCSNWQTTSISHSPLLVINTITTPLLFNGQLPGHSLGARMEQEVIQTAVLITRANKWLARVIYHHRRSVICNWRQSNHHHQHTNNQKFFYRSNAFPAAQQRTEGVPLSEIINICKIHDV